MSQDNVLLPDLGPHNMHDFVDNYVNPALAALLTNSSGPSAPANGGGASKQWQFWLDTSTNPPTLRINYGGAGWSAIGTVNTGTGVFSPAGLAAEITRAQAAEASEVTRAEAAETALHGVLDPIAAVVKPSGSPSALDALSRIITASGQVIASVLRNGTYRILDLDIRRLAGRRDLQAFVDENNGELARFDPRGGLIATPARGDNRDAVTAGARGMPYDVVKQVRNTRYMTSIHGFPAPYVYRRDRDNPAHVFAGTGKATVFIDYGQSWRNAWGMVPAGYQNLGLQELALALRGDLGSMPSTYYPGDTPSINDVHGIITENPAEVLVTPSYDQNTGGGTEIGRMAALTFQKLCLMQSQLLQPVLTFGSSKSSSSWSQAYQYGDGLWLAPGSDAWAQQLFLMSRIPEALAHYDLEPEYAAVGFTHGAYSTAAANVYFGELTDMVYQYSLLGLNTGGRGLHFFTDQSSQTSTGATGFSGQLEQVQFASFHSDIVHLIGPRYPYPLRGDGIHHTEEGYCDIGVLEGYVKFKVLRLGQAWTPLTITGWTITGNTLNVVVTDPFGVGVTKDYVKLPAAPGDGFVVKVAGTARAISSVTIVGGTLISLTLSGAAVPAGTSVELQYAWNATVGFTTDNTRAPAWGNIKAQGPANPLWSGSPAKTIDTWLCAYDGTATAT